MVQIDDIITRSRYINLSNHQQEYNRFHTKSKTLLESTHYRFNDKKFLLQHWESLHENQTECFKLAIDILDEAYEADNIRDFNYTKSYIINEIAPTVRDAKQTAKYLKYKTTRMQNKVAEKVKKNVEDMKNATKSVANNTKDKASKAVSIVKNNVNKSLGKKVTEQDLHEAYVQIMDTLDKYYNCDRILENAHTVQKRFNIVGMVESTDIDNKYELGALVDSICECINTYDADFKTRFNSTLETCFYFLSRKDKNFNKPFVLEEVVDNFISKDFPENKLYEMRSIIDESVVFDSLDKKSVEFVYNGSPFQYVEEIANPFSKYKDERIIKMKDAISKASNDMTDKDVKHIFSAIRPVFTVKGGEVLAECIGDVKTLIKDISKQYSGDNFGKLCAEEVERLSKKRDNRSMDGYLAQGNYIKILNKYVSSPKNESDVLFGIDFYNEGFVSTVGKTVKEIVNDFKLMKTKRPQDIRTCISKMFTKSADEIIDGTPNFLSWIRLTYVIGATAIHPILGAATFLVDQFIAMKLKRRDISKMITVYKNEKKAVAEKINKVDEKDKQNLKEYDKYLNNAISKMEEYEDSLLSEYEKDARDNKEKYNRDEELKSITGQDDDDDEEDDDDDFDDWDDEDFDLEATSFEKTFENSNGFSKEYFTSNIRNCIDYVDEDTIDTIVEVACAHPSIISASSLYSILKEQLTTLSDKYYGSKKWIRMSCLTSNLRKLDPESSEYMVTSDDETSDVFDVINGLEDLFAEVTINKSLGYTNESMSTMAKTIANKLRNTMQKAKDTDKEVSRKIDSSVNMFISGMQRAATNDNREAIIKGSIIPSASKVIKTAIIDGAVALVNPAVAIILALGQFAVSKKMQKKERQLVLDEIDIEIEMCKRYMRQAEDQNDLDAQKQLLRIQRNLERQKQRIQYNMKVNWNQDVPKIGNDDDD